MARGAYDTTIMEEIRSRGRRHPSGRAEEGGQTERDAAVRRMNIRRGKRTGQGPSANSTAYTPERRTDSGSRSKSGREGHEDEPSRKRGPGTETGPIPPPKPPPDPTDDSDWPWGIPGYTPPGKSAPFDPPPEPGGPGGGPGGPVGPGPIVDPDAVPVEYQFPTELLPLLAAVGITPETLRRMKSYPSQGLIEEMIQMRPHVGGLPVTRDVVDAEVMRDPRKLAPPVEIQTPVEPRQITQQKAPLQIEHQKAPLQIEHQKAPPAPAQIESKPGVEIDLGDEKEKAPVKKKQKKPRTKKPKLRIH